MKKRISPLFRVALLGLLALCLTASAGLAEIVPEARSLGLNGVGNARELGVTDEEIELLREKYLEEADLANAA